MQCLTYNANTKTTPFIHVVKLRIGRTKIIRRKGDICSNSISVNPHLDYSMTLIFTRLLLTFRNKTIQMRITVPESTYKRTFFAPTPQSLCRGEKLSLVRQNSLNDSVNWSHLQYCGSNFFNALLSSSNGSRCAVFH
jgi:hypothetical protein